MKSLCQTCKVETNQKILKEHVVKYSEDEEVHHYWETNSYEIIECAGCGEISFRRVFNNIVIESQTEGMEGDFREQEVFPKRDVNDRSLKKYENIPEIIDKVYKQVISAYNNEQNLLATIGVRAIIEATCIDKNAAGDNLYEKITALKQRGLLSSINEEVLQDLRIIGNTAVHEIIELNNSDLTKAIDIIEHTLENIYLLAKISPE